MWRREQWRIAAPHSPDAQRRTGISAQSHHRRKGHGENEQRRDLDGVAGGDPRHEVARRDGTIECSVASQLADCAAPTAPADPTRGRIQL